MAVDLSKAFNRLDHGKLISLLFDMGVLLCPLRKVRINQILRKEVRLVYSCAETEARSVFAAPEGEPE